MLVEAIAFAVSFASYGGRPLWVNSSDLVCLLGQLEKLACSSYINVCISKGSPSPHQCPTNG